MSIYIFSRPVHSGKTTELLDWCNRQKNIAGILMPDIDGSRKMFNIDTREVFDAECINAANTKQSLTCIGKFNFYSAAFKKANSLLLLALSKNLYWLVLDEAGKLELNCNGFYESIVKAVEIYSSDSISGNLLITVRESLSEEVISFFNIKNARIIHHLEDLAGL